jgi:hypothetical protein
MSIYSHPEGLPTRRGIDSAIETSELDYGRTDDYTMTIGNEGRKAVENADVLVGEDEDPNGVYVWVIVLIGFLTQFIGIGISVAW